MVASKKRSSARKDKDHKVCNGQDYGQGLVGSRIRVWWPIDGQFYNGVVDSYNSSKKKHRVLYDDGDKETLNMKKERWELIEEDDDKADEFSLQDDSADESSDATPEALNRKNVKSNGKSSDKGKADEAMPKKKQKIDSSAKSKSKAKSGKKPEDDETKQNQKTGSNLGDIGGKIVAAASRMSGRVQSKQNGLEKETLKSSKKITDNRKQKRPCSSTSEAVSEKVKKQRTSSKKIKSNDTDDEDGDADDVDTSDDESKTLAVLLKKSPEAIEALMEKLKGKKKKEGGEGSSEDEEGGEGSSGDEEGGDGSSRDDEGGDGSSGDEEGEDGSSGDEEGRDGSSGDEEGGEGSSGSEEEEIEESS
ncbi:uncharacterized protein DDB_G0283697 [Eutrema salsugineum]|uniref:uncharacterized protein DDB_G0283697 n=1 Tax=Eutrema salsugineum TaxID=72664 RepID=UPI000CECF368|nr:uncharacterized protein DDB_G0283697 [Eutrema salsugineum]